MTTRPEILDKPLENAAPELQSINMRRISDRLKRVRDERGPAWLFSPLWLCLLVAVLIRVWLIARTHGILDGDEALLGIQAEHILHGAHPIYFYGIPYFGSLEAYGAAILFAIFGPSVAALRAETTGFALILVGVTWWLADLLAETAQLPRRARRWFTTIAALVAALPPLYDGIVELRTGGGWIESFIIMLLLLVSAYRLTTRRHAGATWRELAWRWAGIGFLVGFGMWIYPLVSVAILAAALWIVGERVLEIRKRLHLTDGARGPFHVRSALLASIQTLSDLPLALFALPACLLGFTPGLIWGASNHWANIAYLFSLGGGWTTQRLHTVARVAVKYTDCVAPRVIGGGTPLEGRLLTLMHAPLLLLGVVCTLGTAALVVASFRSSHPLLQRARSLAALPTLFGVCSAALFCTSSASTSILISCTADFGGRYAAPLVLVLPFFFATTFVLAYMALAEKSEVVRHENHSCEGDRTRTRERPYYSTGITVIQSLLRKMSILRPQNIPFHVRILPDHPTPYHSRDAACPRPGEERRVLLLGVLIALLLAYLGGQAATYGLTNADQAFQSPYCTIAPANYAPIIAYMQREKIRYAWATNLLGYQISFETNNAIILADPLPLIQPAIAINRIPAYTDAVARAERPSLLVFVKHGDPHPYLLQTLNNEHIAYQAALFASQPGVDVLIVTPTSRTISPFSFTQKNLFTCETH